MSTKIHIGELICEKVKEDQCSVAWLAKNINHDRSNSAKMLKKESMDTKLLLNISIVLQFNFFSTMLKHYTIFSINNNTKKNYLLWNKV